MNVALFLCSACLSAAISSNEEIDPHWLKQLDTEGRAALREALARSDQLEETLTSRVEKPGKPQENKSIRITTSRKGNLCLFERITTLDAKKDQPHVEIDCRSERYRFSATRKGTEPFRLTGYEQNEPADSARGSAIHAVGYHGLRRALEAVDRKADHVLRAVRWDEGEQLLVVRWEQSIPWRKEKLVEENEIRLEPKHGWRVLEHTSSSSARSGSTKLKYQGDFEGFYYPVEIDESIEFLQRKENARTRVLLQVEVRKTSKPDSAFQLSAFGLPEPRDVPAESRKSSLPWIAAGVLVCLLLALAFVYLARRKRTAPRM